MNGNPAGLYVCFQELQVESSLAVFTSGRLGLSPFLLGHGLGLVIAEETLRQVLTASP